MRFYSQKARKNNTISLFKALELILWRFVSIHAVNFNRKATKFLKLIVLTSLVLTLPTLSTLVFSQERNDEKSIGVSNALDVYPSEFTSSDWLSTEHSLQLDLDEDSLFQKFNDRNSAYLPSAEERKQIEEKALRDRQVESTQNDFSLPVSSDVTSVDETSSTTLQESSNPTDENQSLPLDESPTQSEEPPSVEIVPEETTPEEPAVDDVSVYKRASAKVFTAFSQVFNSFPFLNASTSTEPEDIEVVEDVPVLEDVVEESTLTPLSSQEASEAELSTSTASDPVSVELNENIDVVESNEVASTTATTTEPVEQAETESDTLTIPLEQTRASIVFGDFSIPELEPGEFITGVQLRASLAAQYQNNASDTLPYFEFTYRTGSSSQNVGAVLVDEETSNALNGGYYLFALPTIETESELDDVSIEVSFVGDPDKIEGVYFDALWLEVHTEKITREDLEERTKREIMNNLKHPMSNEFVSDRLDFTRKEAPVFNLRYVSQRSRVVQSIRGLLGYDKVRISEVEVLHGGAVSVGLKLDVNVTADGLISFNFEDSEMGKLKPGKYTVQFTVDEGGYTFQDSFDFQWGMLAINPDKTEYESGEIAELAMGALTPNGNTLCNAHLRLYVIDPAEFIHKIPVERSGLCNGNNVVEVPDYSSSLETTIPGTYEMYLERLNDDGTVISHTSDYFEVVNKHSLSIKRTGPTRIYPVAPYTMSLEVSSDDGFDGTLVERVPAAFAVFDTDAMIKTVGAYKQLTWDLSLLSNDTETLSYSFDAPDISPYLFELGPATLSGNSPLNTSANVQVSSSTASSSVISEPNLPIKKKVRNGFVEHREWQIASDATGNMIIYWDNPNYIPDGWLCLSCGSGTFYQRFAVGSSSYNNTGGAATHSHTAAGSDTGSADAAVSEDSTPTANVSKSTHTHSLTANFNATSSLPAYTNLRVLQATSSAGEPTVIPNGAILIFDSASSSLPANWNRYAALDGHYPYGENTQLGTQFGSNTHSHDVTGTTGTDGGSATRNRPGAISVALTSHTHTITTVSPAISIEPPYIEVLFAKLTATSSSGLPNGSIAMWTEDVPTGSWTDVSTDPSSAFYNRFTKGATTYGTTGGSSSHNHAAITGVVSSQPSGGDVDTARSGGTNNGASGSHTHTFNLAQTDTVVSLPPYISVVYGKKLGDNSVYNQLSYKWFANENNQTPTDPWPAGGVIDVTEAEAITLSDIPVKPDDQLRLRINVEVSNATTTASTSVKLQYAAGDTCGPSLAWLDVGDSSSSTALWRGYDNAIADSSTLSSTTLASTTVAESYEENAYASTTANQIGVDEVGEWDFVLENNGAAAGTNYCFRLVENNGTEFATYTIYPQLLTNSAPDTPTLSTFFDNEKTPTSTALLYFTGSDPESAVDSGNSLITYQVQLATTSNFSSTIADVDSNPPTSPFEDLTNGDKFAFEPGAEIVYTHSGSLSNDTYYWRVRGQDADGSGEWGEWSEIYSFTVDTSLLATGWFQTEDAQFEKNALNGVETSGSNEVDIISGSSTATMTSPPIYFSDATLGTAWGSFEATDTVGTGDITYQIEYQNDSDAWNLIPDGDLPNNSTDIGSSVSLLQLDTETYDTLRLVATFTNGGTPPSLQDWALYWGYRVETPTIAKLFPNEKAGTTTPIFQFTTTDPQDDGLTYEISWTANANADFDISSTTRNSSTTPAGFNNIDNGGQSDPFTSGDIIQYTIQAADALTDGGTYWWRVRAKDSGPGGANAWSFWTDPRSFTVASTTEVSTWYQTTWKQFEGDTLSGTIPLTGVDSLAVATTASEAMVVYGEGSEYLPRYRTWNGTEWSEEGTLESIFAPLKWVEVKESPTREEYVALTLGTDSDVNAQVYRNGTWGNLQEMTLDAGAGGNKGIALAYHATSGDAMVVYCDNAASPSYRIWDGSSWSLEGTITVSETTNCEWVELASNPVSNELVVVVRGSDGSPFEAQVWNDSAQTWGNATTFGSITDTENEGMAVAYEESGNQALVVTSDGNPARFRWNSWTPGTGSWGTAAFQGIGDDFEWGTLVSDVGSDQLALCYQDEDINIGLMRWSGSAWNTFAAGDEVLTTAGKSKGDPSFSCVFENNGANDGNILVAHSGLYQTDYSFWDGAMNSGGQISNATSSITSKLIRTGADLILGLFFTESSDELRFSSWDGSSWATTTAIETNAAVNSSPYGRPYDLAPRGEGLEGTAIAAPEINFTDGLGPYWQEMSWNDQTFGSSDYINYFVQYYDGDSWEMIPNTDLPGNESGTTTGPIDLSGLNKNTYSTIRPYAEFFCEDSDTCPRLLDWTVEWAGGITISGNLHEYDQTTAVDSGTVAVAVNGVLQTGKTGSVAVGGDWTIDNVTVFSGDIVSVFMSSSTNSTEAVGVTRYDGIGDMSGIQLFERHVSLGSNDATTTPLTNSDIGAYNSVNDEDVFLNLVSTSTLDLCTDVGCDDVRLYIASTTYYTPGGNLITHDIQIEGTLTATTTLYVSGSWDNNGTATLTNSTVVMSATSTSESIDSTGASSYAFNNLTFGTTTGNATWTLGSALDVNGILNVSRGTLARATTPITVANNLITGANGFWTGVGTTTFDGTGNRTWSDANVTKQNVGRVVVGNITTDGINKTVTLGSDVAAQSVTIGGNDTLSSTAGSYTLTVYEDWTNLSNFLPGSGEVLFAATTSTYFIDDDGDGFYDLTFSGAGGAWAFDTNTVSVGNDLTIATGTVTMPTGTTTVAGSFINSGGIFQHSNGLIEFTSSGAETLTLSGDALNNAFYDAYFNGGGSWTFTEARATTTNDLTIDSGTVIFPSDTLSVGGSFINTAGAITAGSGTLEMQSNFPETIELSGQSLHNLLLSGNGTITFADTNATVTGDITINAGSLVLPSGTLSVGGSFTNNSSFDANNGELLFNSNAGSETIDFGSSNTYDVTFNAFGGDWTIISDATTTNDFALTQVSSFTLDIGQTLAIGNSFSNLSGASTTWSSSVLSLYGGTYTINDKDDSGDLYDNTLLITNGAKVSSWNSTYGSVSAASGSYLYSMDNVNSPGDLYIWGDYTRATGTEYWSYATDFDGADLTGSERSANVRFASGASANFTDASLEIVGGSSATTTITNQGTGSYTVSVSGGTTTARYYYFSDLGSAGFSLLDSVYVTSLRDGYFNVTTAGGSALTIASSTIETTPGKQIYNVGFSTSSAISAFNVSSATSSSYWWFRNSYGNLDGESFDDDNGNPGSIRWDDSALVLTISGHIYSDAGSTLLGGVTCDGDANQPVTVVVENAATYTGSCTSTSSYSISGVTVVGDPTLTVYLNGADGGEKAVVVTKTPTTDISDMDLYVNRVIVRHEDIDPITIEDMTAFENGDDPAGITFAAATGTEDTLNVEAGNELYVWNNKIFAPGGSVVLAANASPNDYDGTLHLGPNATFTGIGTTTYTIGGSIDLENGATFTPASSTILMIATTSGKYIDTASTSTLDVHELQFTGVGGGWNINGNVYATDDIQVATGTVSGTGDITLTLGSLYGSGLVSMGGGTTLIESTNTLGGTQAWTFNNLTLGDGIDIGTTTPANNATTTVLGILTISSAHFLDANSSIWDLTGSGTPFVETGNLLEDTSTFIYSGSSATNIISTDYYNLTLDAAVGTPTYTAIGLGLQVFGDLVVGGTSPTTINFDTNDAALNIDGDLTIDSNGTFIASNSASLTVAGDYDNNGVFTANGGSVLFDGSGTQNIAAGASDFATVNLSGTSAYTLEEHATATTAFTIGSSATGFTLNSGQTLAVGGTFTNALGGAVTDWSGSELYLYGGGNYEINAKTVADNYETITIAAGTQIRMWGSQATTTNVTTGSLYSMDHAGTPGDLYIYGDYTKSSGIDHWSYTRDFDGVDLGGGDRAVDVYVRGGGSVTYQGASQLSILGVGTGSTTVQNQGSGVYAMTLTGTASTTMNYYEFRDVDSDGVTFDGNVQVDDLSRGYFLVANNSDSAMTVSGTALNSSPARTFARNIFATSSGVTTATNVTVTGSSVSSWRFTLHSGDIDGENFDSDNGDPGYIGWDDSIQQITIQGKVLQNDRTSTSTACSATTNIHLYVEGNPAGTSNCLNGFYSISGVSYSSTSELIVFIDGETENGATVTQEPISDIYNMDIYEDHVIVRHEGVNALTNTDLNVYDSDQDVDIPFTVTTGDLTLPSDTTLLVWSDKAFEPLGNVTVPGGGGGSSYDGTVELQDDAIWTGNSGEIYTIGGSLLSGTGATYNADTSTTTFTSTVGGRTIDVNDGSFYNLEFTGSGSWSVTDTTLNAHNVLITSGTVTLPTGTTTISGFFNNSGGTFNSNGSTFNFNGSNADLNVSFGGDDAGPIYFTGTGSWSMNDVNATSTAGVTITNGTVTLPSGTLALSGSFRNVSGDVTHNTSLLYISTSSTASVLASSSDLYSVTFAGGGTFSFEDENLTLLDSLILESGSMTLASGTLSIGGSFDASGGTFSHATGSILFNSNDTGETIDPGSSDFYTVVFANPAGGWTILDSATTTNIFSLNTASDFTLQSGSTLYVGGVFTNNLLDEVTDWSGSTLFIDTGVEYPINASSNGDSYDGLIIGANTDISSWNSQATTTTVDLTSSWYSKDHASSSGSLYIFGDYHISTTTQCWSYATNYDCTSLSGSERAVTVSLASGATTTVDGGTLNIVGSSGNETTITNQGSGQYAFAVNDGTFNAQYYAFRNLNTTGLDISGTPVISSLSYGDYELAVNGGSLINLSSTTLNYNASLVIAGNRFATSTAITGTNVYLTGSTSNVWTFTGHTGNLDGEDFDQDGFNECGSIRWDDSDCLITQQTHYRWRDDNGGLGVPDSEWYHASWTKRVAVRIDNADAVTYTDAVVELSVPYDLDMQSDYSDLLFTDDTGTTSTPHFVASTTNATAEVWVKVPELPASDTAVVYMYYGNTTATNVSSSTETFIAADDFEDNNITEYSGANDDKASFSVTNSQPYGNSSYALDNSSDVNGHADDGGIARFDQNFGRSSSTLGVTIRYMQYVDTNGSNDEVCTLFGVQSPVSNNSNYAVCTEQLPGTDYLYFEEDVVDTAINSGTTLDSTAVTYSNGWYEVEIDWETDGDMTVTLYNDNESQVAQLTATDGSHTSGGYGFTYWANEGSWDNFSVRPLLLTEPTVRFGAESVAGGASWAEVQDTAYDTAPNNTIRLRLAIENSGLPVTNRNYDLEYAKKGTAPSCESIGNSSYATVPNQSSCGSSPLCMQTSSNFINGAGTTDMLTGTEGVFSAGQAVESPSNSTGNINIDQDYYTELEYAITATNNATSSNYCLRVTDSGSELDTYLRVAELIIRFDPTLGTISFNNGDNISLVGGTTTRVYATTTVTDLNGYTDIVAATSTMYTTSATAACNADNNDCYIETLGSSCSLNSCSGNSCVLQCYADFYYHTDATFSDGGEFWQAFFEVEDNQGGVGFNTSPSIDVFELTSLEVDSAINYGSLYVASSTGSYNPTTTVQNIGNTPIDVNLDGTDLTDGGSSQIPTSYQYFATSTFDYETCSLVTQCTPLSTTTIVGYELDLTKPTTTTPAVVDYVYWGIEIPFGAASNPHSGVNTFYAVTD